MKINFLNEYYKSRAGDQNSSDLVNMYLEEDKAQGKYQLIALPTPGLSVFNDGSGSVVRGCIEHRGIAYAVIDDTFYSYVSNGTRTSRGTLNTSSGQVQLSSISNQIVIIDSGDGYNYNTVTLSFAVISDGDFPSAPSALTAQDETFLVSDGTGAVYGSDVADGTSWSALSFSTKNGPGDYVSALFSNKELVYVLGNTTSDTWQDSGAATFSFEPVGLGGFFHYGCAARNSVARCQDKVYFLAQSPEGGKEVVVIDQYTVKPISSRAITYQINQLTTHSDAFAYCYTKAGHSFYVLTFPTDAVTFMYDTTTDLWSELQSYISSSYTRHISNCYMYCYGKHLVGAYNSGTIYVLDDSVYTDNGAQILRRLVTPPGYAEGKKLYMDRVQIDTQTGVGSNLSVTLDISYDSGQTYPTSYTNTIPSAGGRMFWTRLGMTQNAFVLKLSTTINAKFCVLGAVAEVRTGVH